MCQAVLWVLGGAHVTASNPYSTLCISIALPSLQMEKLSFRETRK